MPTNLHLRFLKGIVHPTNENLVIIHSPKPMTCGTQIKVFFI